MLPIPPAHARSLGPGGAEVLRLITICQRVLVCLTVHVNGRRRYGYWQPFSSGSGRGGCCVGRCPRTSVTRCTRRAR